MAVLTARKVLHTGTVLRSVQQRFHTEHLTGNASASQEPRTVNAPGKTHPECRVIGSGKVPKSISYAKMHVKILPARAGGARGTIQLASRLAEALPKAGMPGRQRGCLARWVRCGSLREVCRTISIRGRGGRDSLCGIEK